MLRVALTSRTLADALASGGAGSGRPEVMHNRHMKAAARLQGTGQDDVRKNIISNAMQGRAIGSGEGAVFARTSQGEYLEKQIKIDFASSSTLEIMESFQEWAKKNESY